MAQGSVKISEIDFEQVSTLETEREIVPEENGSKAVIWRCGNVDQSNQKKYGNGCGRFYVLWTKLREGNSKRRFFGRCPDCGKTSSLSLENGNIILWEDDRQVAKQIAEQMNGGEQNES